MKRLWRGWDAVAPLLRRAALPGLVAAAAFCVYANGLSGSFVSDDYPIIVENPLVTGRAPTAAIFTSGYWTLGQALRPDMVNSLYRPLTMLSYALNFRAKGLDPFWFHAVNVALHALNSVLLLLLLGRFGFSRGARLFGGLSFAVLTVHVEAVSWIVGRAELLATAFALAGWLLSYRGAAGVFLAACCYGLALFSKESAAAFPAVLILGDFFEGPGSWRETVRRRLPAWALMAGVLTLYLFWRHALFSSAFGVGTPYFSGRPLPIVWLTMGKFFMQGWLRPMLTATGLSADYSRPSFPDAAVSDPWAWLALFAAMAVAIWTIRSFLKSRSGWSFGLLTLLVLALPLSNLVVPMEIIGAERIMYLPSIGFCIALAALWGRRGPWVAAIGLSCLAWWSVQTVRRNRIWTSNEAFWSQLAATSPRNPRALVEQGLALDAKGRHAQARDLYQQALRSSKNLPQAHYNMARSYFVEGKYPEAESWARSASQVGGRLAHTYCLWGVIAQERGGPREALDRYMKALESEPHHLEARRNLGLLLYRLGDTRNALSELKKYVDDETDPQARGEMETFIEQAKR